MNPVSYQGMLSPVNGGHPSLVLDRVLGSSNVKCCQKCGFASTDAAELKRHMLEHRGTRFYCFYCNKVSFSEAELNAHLKQHSSKYPFKCPHCGQGYMRRLCLVKHIDRLHSKNTSQGPAKQNPHVPVSSALSSVHTADPASLRPAVRVTVPVPSAPAARQGRDDLRGKTLETNASNGNADLLTPLNGLIQHNRALTVSLPEEVTIPAGCLVELVEVKTVNGTKELKLRLVSQQENESVIKETRTTVSQNTALGKPFSSSLNHPNAVKNMSMGMCTVNRKQFDSKTMNAERPAVCPVTISKNIHVNSHVNKEKAGFKRASQEIINLESHTVVPNKVPKSILNPVREGNNGGLKDTQSEPVNHGAALPSVICNRAGQRFTSALHPDIMGSCVSQRAGDERKNLIPEHSNSIPPRRANDAQITHRDVSLAVKLEPGEISLKNDTASKIKTEEVGSNQQHSSCPSLSVLLAASAQVRPSPILVCKDTASSPPFSNPRSLNESSPVKKRVLSTRKGPKVSTWTQEVGSGKRAGDALEPEGFPVISSVFSLSQQPEDVQGAMQPLVMALRGIVMDKSNGPSSRTQDHAKVTNGTDLAKEALASCAQLDTKDGSIIHKLLLAERAGSTTQDHATVTNFTELSKEELASCAQVDAKDGSIIHKLLLTKRIGETLKVEATEDKGNQHPPAPTHNHIKKEKPSATTKTTDSKKRRCAPASKSSRHEESVFQIAGAHVAAEPLQQVAKGEHDISKFLTVSLKRVQVGLWKKNKKGLKLRISKYKIQVPMGSLTDCAVIYPMPLKSDQLVTRPSPYQPVVVLNHPKPRAAVQGARPDTVADTPESALAPKCQILKMRLSKVMGQKYEVMGCTVGVFP